MFNTLMQLGSQFTTARQEDLGPQLPPLSVLLVDEHVNCSVEQLWSIICQPDPKFQHTIHTLSGNRDIQYGSWSQEGKLRLDFDVQNKSYLQSA